MGNGRFLQHGLVLALALAACDDSFRKTACDDIPTPAGCSQLGSLDPAPRIPRVKTLLNLRVPNLAKGARPKVTIAKGTTTTQVELDAISAAADDVLTIDTESALKLEGGPIILSVCLGARCTQANTLLYTPPDFSVAASATTPYISPFTVARSALMMLPPDLGSSDGLFVAEQDDSMNQSVLSRFRFDSVQRTLVADGSFGPVRISELPNRYRGLFAVSAKAAYAYQYSSLAPAGFYLTPFQLNPFMKGAAIPVSDRQSSRPDATLFSADPRITIRMLADPEQIDVFHFEYGSNYQPLASLMLAAPLRALAAQTVSLDLVNPNISTTRYSFDAVGVDQNNKIQVYRFGANVLSVDQTLTDAANAVAAPGLKTDSVAGLAVLDLDRDGFADIVLALQDTSGETRSVAWLPYRGGGKFDELQRAPLTGTPLRGVLSLAVGKLNGDDKPDIALATASIVQTFLNQSP